MKAIKILCVILTFLMILGLCSCNAPNEQLDADTSPNETRISTVSETQVDTNETTDVSQVYAAYPVHIEIYKESADDSYPSVDIVFDSLTYQNLIDISGITENDIKEEKELCESVGKTYEVYARQSVFEGMETININELDAPIRVPIQFKKIPISALMY